MDGWSFNTTEVVKAKGQIIPFSKTLRLQLVPQLVCPEYKQKS